MEVREANAVYTLQPSQNNNDLEAIPNGWRLVPLSHLSAFITKGATPTTYGFKWENSGVLFLRSECVSESGLDLAQSMYISQKAHATLNRSAIVNGDILITITGNVGRAVRYLNVEEANLNQHIARVRIVSNHADPSFIYHSLSQPSVRQRFNSITTGQAYPQLSLKQVRDVQVPLPPLQEQKAISDALSDADALIEALEELLAKKRQIKQGAMQELLTGHRRLPGFANEWSEQCFGGVAHFQVGFPFSSIFFNEGNQGERLIKNRDLKNDDQVVHFSGQYPCEYLVEDGDVLVGMDGDFVPCIWSKGKALLNQRVGRVVPNSKLDRKFAFYFLIDPLKEIERATSATTVKHLSHSDIEGIKRPLPKLEEQTAIATILADMDADIAALEAKLAKARDLKQGMMQQLLTGRIRLL